MFVSEPTAERLRWHAGLITGDAFAGSASLDELLFAREPGSAEFGAAIDDVLRTLQSLNVELNGEVPSSSISMTPADVPRGVAYSVSEITSRLRAKGQTDAASAVDVAWNAVLAGDIDDVVAHVREERDAAR